jgi:hypothetical protein
MPKSDFRPIGSTVTSVSTISRGNVVEQVMPTPVPTIEDVIATTEYQRPDWDRRVMTPYGVAKAHGTVLNHKADGTVVLGSLATSLESNRGTMVFYTNGVGWETLEENRVREAAERKAKMAARRKRSRAKATA